MLDYHGKVYPVLGKPAFVRSLPAHLRRIELSADVPSEQAQKRWLGEPVRAVVLPTKIFTSNAKGFPVLSPAHQCFIIKLIKVDLGFARRIATASLFDLVKSSIYHQGHSSDGFSIVRTVSAIPQAYHSSKLQQGERERSMYFSPR